MRIRAFSEGMEVIAEYVTADKVKYLVNEVVKEKGSPMSDSHDFIFKLMWNTN